MTIKELKDKIKDLSDDMNVYMAERLTEYSYGLVNSIRIEEVDFLDEDFEVVYTENALVLREE